MEIIGVIHEEGNVNLIDAVLTYIDARYPNLHSIMLETPPDYEYFQKHGWNVPMWFSDVAEYYKLKRVRIIHGDIKRGELMGKSSEEVLEILQRDLAEYNRLFSFGMCKGFFNGNLLRNRNKGLDSMFQQEKPEVSVVGAVHGKYLKKRHPETYFSYFKVPSLIDRLWDWTISGVADKTYIIK